MTNFNDFRGRAKKIEDIDLPRIGYLIGVGEDEVHAVLDVESAGSGFDSSGRPKILFERHHFYRRVPKELRDKAVQQGLATRNWSRATYNQDQYSLLKRAMKIDSTAALLSCSWGLGQIMGWNHKVAGYDTVEEMVLDFMDDEENHLEAMINFIKNNNLDDELRRHDWAGFAKGYNGKYYYKNKYDVKLANSYAKWSRIKNTPWSPSMEKDKTPQKQPQKPVQEIPKDSGTNTPENTNSSVEPSNPFIKLLINIFKTIFGGK